MAMMSNVHETQTVYNVVQDPQMVLLSKKGAHGVSVNAEILPKQSHPQVIPSVTTLNTDS